MKNEPFVIERSFNVPVQRVWDAITNKKKMMQWYFDIPDFEPIVGCKFSFTGESEGTIYVHLCEVKEVEFPKKLTYSWRYEGFEGDSLVTFELFEEGASTKLKLTHAGLETFPANNPHFAKGNFVEGWTYIIGTSLADYVKRNESISEKVD
ncbi:SRPBCC family protein [Solitalea lacus]|uniref:SRPBCC family protein n=1 Tax=Solitalea lacus TaxID=2911172 RepID=UPI001ED9E40A|nr:SRPBCC domain-containing protein [Solitalea lacus]UKJ08878.1 SRPBCC domain-containing protein [Solitalea lacus]